MRELFIDLETYSATDIKLGAYKYAEDPDFEILLMSYAFDDDPVEVWDFYNQGDPPWLRDALEDPQIIKLAWNFSFERSCLNSWLGMYTEPEQWLDIMTIAARAGLPMKLETAGAVLQLEEQKMEVGKSLINYFCKPCKPTKVNGMRRRNLPEHAPEKWATFVQYCARDAEVERAIYRRFRSFPVSETEQAVEHLDARINDRGVPVDLELVNAAIQMDEAFKASAEAEFRRLTGIDKVKSNQQFKAWLEAAGVRAETVNKKVRKELRKSCVDPTTRRVLELKDLLSKSSTKKYETMRDAACKDSRVHGTLRYYGATRTGRWAGRLLQVQNLPQNHLEHIEEYREIVRGGDLTGLRMFEPDVPDVLSQLIRTAILAEEGRTFLVADYHAIEAVCLAYLAAEKWRLDVFAGDGKIYEASYSQAFGVPKESVKKGSPERQKGKIMELALGYGGGVNALLQFGADKLGLSDPEMQGLVDRWRMASPRVVQLWRSMERQAKQALRSPGHVFSVLQGETGYRVCAFKRDREALRMILPSGRLLSYWGAFDDDGGLTFYGLGQKTHRWERITTWGGRLVENLTQAFARDILAEAMLRLDAAGYDIVFSVHDEVICEAPKGASWQAMARIMEQEVDWAPRLGRYLEADGYETEFYKKD